VPFSVGLVYAVVEDLRDPRVRYPGEHPDLAGECVLEALPADALEQLLAWREYLDCPVWKVSVLAAEDDAGASAADRLGGSLWFWEAVSVEDYVVAGEFCADTERGTRGRGLGGGPSFS